MVGSDETPGADPIETTGAEHRTERWSAAGLWDPEAPDAQVRGALLDYLESLGANVERMARAEAEGELVALGLDMLLEDGGLTVEQLATRMGVPVHEVVAAYRLVGVEVNDPAAPMFEEAEIDFVALLTSTAGTFPDAATREILRALSTALSGLSAAAISAFVGSVEDDLAGAGDPVAQARVTREAGLMGLDLAGGLRPLLRHHLRQASGGSVRGHTAAAID